MALQTHKVASMMTWMLSMLAKNLRDVGFMSSTTRCICHLMDMCGTRLYRDGFDLDRRHYVWWFKGTLGGTCMIVCIAVLLPTAFGLQFIHIAVSFNDGFWLGQFVHLVFKCCGHHMADSKLLCGYPRTPRTDSWLQCEQQLSTHLCHLGEARPICLVPWFSKCLKLRCSD